MNKPEKKEEYVLVNDVTGKPPIKNEPVVIEAYGFKVKVPHPPKKNCKRCRRTGFLGRLATSKIPVICPKCYPKGV
jgi:hypothetical protein